VNSTEATNSPVTSLPATALPATTDSKSRFREELGIFASTFITIFLAELGDKTQVTTLLLSAQSHAPWVVFAGAGAALVATSLVGVLLGRWLARKVPPRTLEVSVAILLLVIAALLVWDVVQG
jgi:Ca2+/H+ antiporter, TMEM165/GDT1 family